MACGFDLIKDPAVLVPAYSDSAGITAEFNFNLLDRLNRELRADLQRDRFRHEARFNLEMRRMESHLVAQERHTVSIPGVGKKVFISRKENPFIRNLQ